MSKSPELATSRIFAEALDLPPAERDAFIDAECAGADARAEIHRLLTLHTAAGSFLETPLPELLAGVPGEPAELSPGELLKARYQVERVLARSGFATVYLALDRDVAGKPVVIKVLDRVRRASALQPIFQSELQSLSRLRHPNIVGISDVGELSGGIPFLVVDYVEGVTLRVALDVTPAMDRNRIAAIVSGIANALSAAHRAGIFHLDLKPENVILSDAGTGYERVTLIDFGIAAIRDIAHLAPGAGSPRYMAPEQRTAPGEKCDIFALARIASEMFTGTPATTGRKLAARIAGREAGAISVALSPDPTLRQASVEQFVRELQGSPRRTFKAAAAVLGFCALAGLWLFARGARRVVKPTGDLPRPLPLVTAPGYQRHAAFSPAGDWIYFVSDGKASSAIFRKSAAGGEAELVIPNVANDGCFALSPNGESIVYVRDTAPAGALFLSSSHGGKERLLIADRGSGCMTWTPDGKAIVFSPDQVDHRGQPLHMIAAGSHSDRQFDTGSVTGAADTVPAFSPDGKRIAFVRTRDPGKSQILVAETGKDFTPVSPAREICSRNDRIVQVQWTPDGRELLYVAGPRGNGAIWRISVAGGQSQPLLQAAGRVDSIAIPARAWKLAYTADVSDTNIWKLKLPPSGGVERVVAGSYDDEGAHLSRDGKWLAFTSSRSGEEQEWLAHADGSQPRQLTWFHAADAVEAFWTHEPDALIVTVRSKELGTRFYSMRIGSTSLTEIERDGMAASVSHDGLYVYFRRRVGQGPWQIWRTAVAGAGTPEQLTAGGGYYARDSPDGKWLYFTFREEDRGIWRQRLASNAASSAPPGRLRPAERVTGDVYRRNLFVPTRKGLYYIARPAGESVPFLFLKAMPQGRAALAYRFASDIFWGLDLAPDERSLLFSQYDVNHSEIMLIAEFH